MEIVVLKSHPAQAACSIEGICRELSALLAGTSLNEMDGKIYSIEPDSRDAYVKVDVDRLEGVIGRLGLATKATQKRLLRD